MTASSPRYGAFFPPGQRVRLGIPLAGGGVFSEWGTVVALDGDLVTLRLSRDQLPDEALLRLGNMLELKAGKDGTFYACRSLIIDEYADDTLQLRLTGTPELDDLRQYYRIDVYLPFKYSIPCDPDPEIIRKDWLAMHDLRAGQGERQASFIPFPHDHLCPTRQHSGVPWDEHLPVAANISGGGLKVKIPGLLSPGELINIELYLPVTPPRVIDIVGKVVSATRVETGEGGGQLLDTALTFHHIAERDRDAIIAFIAGEQLERLRSSPRLDVATQGESPTAAGRRQPFFRLAAAIGVLLLLYLLARSLASYHRGHEKNEIESIFEGGVKKYLEKSERRP